MKRSFSIEGLKFTFENANFFISENEAIQLLKHSFPLPYDKLDSNDYYFIIGLFLMNFPLVIELIFVRVNEEISTNNNFLLREIKSIPK